MNQYQDIEVSTVHVKKKIGIHDLRLEQLTEKKLRGEGSKHRKSISAYHENNSTMRRNVEM